MVFSVSQPGVVCVHGGGGGGGGVVVCVPRHY